MQNGPLAQLVEQLTLNQWVTGSNPVWFTILLLAVFITQFFIFLGDSNMDNLVAEEKVIELLNKKYILLAISKSCKLSFRVKLYNNRFIFTNENMTLRFLENEFKNIISQYNFYLINDDEDVIINQEFDPLTLKQ